MFKKMKKLMDTNVGDIALVACGVVVGASAMFLVTAYVFRNAHILREAKWTPQGDMMLTFFHRTNGILIPRPGS